MDSLLRLILKAKGKLEYEHQEATSRIPSVGELWEPTRRDHGDWSLANEWFNRLGKGDRNVVRERSYNPPSSFRQIAEMLQVSKVRAFQIYEKAIDRVHEIANRVT